MKIILGNSFDNSACHEISAMSVSTQFGRCLKISSVLRRNYKRTPFPFVVSETLYEKSVRECRKAGEVMRRLVESSYPPKPRLSVDPYLRRFVSDEGDWCRDAKSARGEGGAFQGPIEDECRKKRLRNTDESPLEISPCHCAEKKDDPCKKDKKRKRRDEDDMTKYDPCKKEKKDDCKKEKQQIDDLCKRIEEICKKRKKDDKDKKDPCKKKDDKDKKKDDKDKKKDPCKKKDDKDKKKDPCKKKDDKDKKKDDKDKKKDPCKKKDDKDKKKDPCKKKDDKKKDDPCKKKDDKKKDDKKDDPCKKKDDKKKDDKKKKDDPCKKKDDKKKKDDPCKKKDDKKTDDKKKDDPCKKKNDKKKKDCKTLDAEECSKSLPLITNRPPHMIPESSVSAPMMDACVAEEEEVADVLHDLNLADSDCEDARADNPYHRYNKYSFYDVHVHLTPERSPQPSSLPQPADDESES